MGLFEFLGEGRVDIGYSAVIDEVSKDMLHRVTSRLIIRFSGSRCKRRISCEAAPAAVTPSPPPADSAGRLAWPRLCMLCHRNPTLTDEAGIT
eukprot:scaffold269953_cov66-Attheya_sp.AAC.3